MEQQTVNVLFLGCIFLLFFSAADVIRDLMKPLLSSAREDNPDFKVDGYLNFSLYYASFAITSWFCPSAIAILGPQITMFVGTFLDLLFLVAIFFENSGIFYTTTVISGFGAALIWTASSTYLVLNSSEETLGKNTGRFWFFYQCGLFPGNLLVFFLFQNTTVKIEQSTRQQILIACISILALAGFLFLFLRSPKGKKYQGHKTPLQAMKDAGNIFFSKKMLILTISIGYAGLHLSFIAGEYGACIGFTLRLGEGVKKYIPLAGIFLGVGEIFGSVLVNYFGEARIWRINVFYSLAAFFNIVFYAILFVSLPAKANFGNTYESGIIEPRLWLLLFAAFVFGMNDCFLNTQIYILLGLLYPESSAPAFSIFKFLRNIFMAASYFGNMVVQLNHQLIALMIFATLGSISFNLISGNRQKKAENNLA